MEVAHHLTTVDGITTGYWIENLHLVYKSMHGFEWYRMTC